MAFIFLVEAGDQVFIVPALNFRFLLACKTEATFRKSKSSKKRPIHSDPQQS